MKNLTTENVFVELLQKRKKYSKMFPTRKKGKKYEIYTHSRYAF